jgi:TolA-binding protein
MAYAPENHPRAIFPLNRENTTKECQMKKNLVCLTISALLSSLAFQANATISSMTEQSVSRAERPEKPQKPEKKEKVGALEMRIDQLARAERPEKPQKPEKKEKIGALDTRIELI